MVWDYFPVFRETRLTWIKAKVGGEIFPRILGTGRLPLTIGRPPRAIYLCDVHYLDPFKSITFTLVDTVGFRLIG